MMQEGYQPQMNNDYYNDHHNNNNDRQEKGYYNTSYQNWNPKPNSGFSTAALVCGIVALVMLISCFFTVFSFIPAIAGIILALVSKSKLGRWQDTALGGFICSIIALVIFLFLLTIGIYIYNYNRIIDPGQFIEEFNSDDPSIPDNNNNDGDIL